MWESVMAMRACVTVGGYRLDGNDIGADGARALAEALPGCGSLRVLRCGDAGGRDGDAGVRDGGRAQAG